MSRPSNLATGAVADMATAVILLVGFSGLGLWRLWLSTWSADKLEVEPRTAYWTGVGALSIAGFVLAMIVLSVVF